MGKRSRRMGAALGGIMLAVVLAVALGWQHTVKTLEAQHQAEVDELNRTIDLLRNPRGGVAENGRLRVEGSQILNEEGRPFVLRGFSSHGLSWYPQYTNYPALKQLKDSGANVFRAAMYVDQYNGYLTEQKLSTALMLQAVENALAADLYAVVDWHVLQDENPLNHVEEAKTFFADIASTYGNEPGILYEICNEPNGTTTFDEIRAYADEVIPVIRKYAPDALILVGTPEFSSALDEAVNAPLRQENVVYTYHFYANYKDADTACGQIARALQADCAVLVSEWGFSGRELSGRDWENTVKFLDFLDASGVGWINWSVCNKDESYSILKPDSRKVSGWGQEDLTDIGRYVLDRLPDPET